MRTSATFNARAYSWNDWEDSVHFISKLDGRKNSVRVKL